MIVFNQPLALILLLPLLYLWWRLGRGPREAWWGRILILALGVLIITSPTVHLGKEDRHLVLLVDKSLSCGEQVAAMGEETARLLLKNVSPEDKLSIVSFGMRASVVSSGGKMGQTLGGPYEDASDLSAGLALAGSLLSGRRGGRILLLSDGFHTGPDPMERVPQLLKGGVSVDTIPVIQEEKRDVALAGVRLPERVQEGHPFEISFTVYSPLPAEETLRIQRAGKLKSHPVRLNAGENRFTFRDVAGPAGLIRYTISVSGSGDSRPENNRALAVTNAVGPPRILVLNQGGGADGQDPRYSNLTRTLEAAGMTVTLRGREAFLTSADLKAFAAIVLENLSLSMLNDRADAALRNFVRDTGGGLLITGGRRSFAEGGYYQSRLEDVLPVSMMRKEQYLRSKIAMCLVLDRSGSMSVPVGRNLTKMDLANRAAVEAIGVLLPQDDAAVIAVDSTPHPVLPLTTLDGNEISMKEKVLSIESMGGGIFVYTGLCAAVNELLKSKAETRHIVLFADAADSEEPGDYQNLIDKWVKGGGTISVIGLGTAQDQDASFLVDIASRGEGSVFFTEDPHALPRIFCEDAIRVARKTFLEQETGGEVSPEIFRIGRLNISTFPSVLGYNLCHTKEGAAQLITTMDENRAPLLAVQQSGLGRVAALTCEADGPYTGSLREWPQYKPLLSSIVKWLERKGDDVALFGTIIRSGRTAAVVLEMDEETARTSTDATAYIIPPSEADPITLPMRWVSPLRMEATFRLQSDGVYHGIVVTREGKRVSLPAVVLPYSPEFEPVLGEEGRLLLEGLANATGGKRRLHVQELLDAPRADAREPVKTAPFLAALLLLLVLQDIVTRKHLWAYLIPGFAGKSAEKARVKLSGFTTRARGWLQRREKTEVPPVKDFPQDEKEQEVKKTPSSKKESVFRRAKKRSRAGEDPS